MYAQQFDCCHFSINFQWHSVKTGLTSKFSPGAFIIALKRHRFVTYMSQVNEDGIRTI
jgi:hypothetical protein